MTSAPSDAPAAVARVAAFDLDGTLIWADSFALFLRALIGPAFLRRCARLAPRAGAFVVGAESRDAMKAAIARRFLTGVDVEEAQAAARSAADAYFDAVMRADAHAALRAHQAAGEETVIVTASPEIAAAPIAERLGCRLVGTRLEAEGGRLTGRLDGANCRGPEKVARLRALIGPRARIVAAYGDSAGDREMLAAAETSALGGFRGGPRAPWLAAARLLL